MVRLPNRRRIILPHLRLTDRLPRINADVDALEAVVLQQLAVQGSVAGVADVLEHHAVQVRAGSVAAGLRDFELETCRCRSGEGEEPC